MILFVFEGRKSEPKIFDTIKELFFGNREESIVCCYESNIYSLYNTIKRDSIGFGTDINDISIDIVSILREKKSDAEDNPFANIDKSFVFEEIYLIFDYDFQEAFNPIYKNDYTDWREVLKQKNIELTEMLSFFNDETSVGKLFVNYPMVDSLFFTKKLPDSNFATYTASIDICRQHKFKQRCDQFTDYKGYAKLLCDKNTPTDIISNNWKLLNEQNIKKANFICTGNNEMPAKKDDVAQNVIFQNQLEKYVNTNDCCVSILNAFPLFLYEYFK